MRGGLLQFDGVTAARIRFLETLDVREIYGMVEPGRNAGVDSHLPGPAQRGGDVFQCATEHKCGV